MNQQTQKIGGYAALTEAMLYIIGFVFLFVFLRPTMDVGLSEVDKLAYLLKNKALYQAWNLLIYVVFGIVLIPLTISINEQFQPSFIGTKVSPVFGFIWSGLVIASGMIISVGLNTVADMFGEYPQTSLNTWKTIESIHNGLGGGVEVVGGLWVLLISLSGLKQKVFPKYLNYLGLIVGLAGILTIIPGLEDLGAIFGLSQIFWFIWIGMVLLRKKID